MTIGLHSEAQRTWTLAECIDHAVNHNISLQRARANVETQDITLHERRGALLPSLSAAVQQGLNWRPLTEAASNFVNNGIASASAKHVTYSGSYGINASWMAWNGGRNHMNIQQAEMSRDIASLAVAESTNAIAVQIAQLFIQIMYMEEALKVNEQLLEHDRILYARGADMVEQGQMSRSDLVQLEAQVASGEYDVVSTRTNIAQSKLSLKQLLEFAPEDEIAIASSDITDAQATMLIPDKMDVFEYALANRPEIRSADINIEQSRLTTKIARTSRLPSLSFNAGISDSHMSGGQTYGTQFRNNFAGQLSAAVQIPLFDQRQTKASIQRAQVNETIAAIDRRDAEKKLFENIEQYWLNATNSQKKYLASKVQVKSLTTNYDLLEEQFQLGLKNTVEVLQARSNLLQAQQNNLQDKFTTVLNLLLLEFYKGHEITL